MLVFFCSAFLRIYLVSTFSLAFMLNSFSLLTTVKNIAVTQLYYNLRPRTTQPKRRCFNLSKFIVKPFLPPGLNKTSLAPGLYFFLFFFLIRLKLPQFLSQVSHRNKNLVYACLTTILPSQNSCPHPTWRLSLGSLNTRVPCLCHIFSRTLNANPPSSSVQFFRSFSNLVRWPF